MDLRKLEYFEAVARLSSFTKASKELNVAQPSITNAIKNLEKELQIDLFMRDKRNVALTPEGEIFLKRVSKILKDCQAAADEIRDLAEKKQWQLRLGIPPTLGAEILQKLYCDFIQEYPKVILSIMEIGSSESRERLEKREIDLGYMVLEPGLPFGMMTLDRGEVMALMNCGHPLSGRDRLSLMELKDEMVINQPPFSYIQRRIVREYGRQGIEMKCMTAPGSIISTYNLVAHGGCITYVLGNHYKHLVKEERLMAVPLNPPICYEAGFAWNKEYPLNKAAKACINLFGSQ